MDENRCCGNVDSSYAKDMDSFCVREYLHKFAVCNEDSDHHTRINNVWTEITPDNVDDIYNLAESRFVDVLDSRTMVVKGVNDWHCTLSTMSKNGGYYYYVLPELRVD